MNTKNPVATSGNPPHGGGRICLVEDSKTAAYAIGQTLRMLGHKVEHFVDAREAFAALSLSRFDLLVTDLGLRPGAEQGDDLIKMVRAARDESVRRLPILVLTGDREGETLVRVFEAGANDHLSKSASTQELTARVSNLLRIKRTYDDLSQTRPTEAVKGLVCLVEDSRTYAYVIQRDLKEQGYAVEHFTQARAALEAIGTRPYDIVLTDLRLDGDMDGDALTAAIRQLADPMKHRLPVVVITSNQEEATLLQVFAAGANDYLTKPVRGPELLARLRNLIQVKRDFEASLQREADAQAVSRELSAMSVPVVQSTATQGSAAQTTEPASRDTISRSLPEPGLPAGISWSEQLGRWVTAYPWLFLIGTILLAVGSASGLQRIGFTDDYRVYFSERNPELRAFNALEHTYAKNYNALLVLKAPQATVFTQETLGAVEWLTEAAWKIPYSSRVDSLTNFQHTHSEGDELIVHDLVSGAAKLSDEALQQVSKVALAEPLLVNRLVSPSGHVTGINVSLQLPGHSPNETQQIVDYCKQLVAQFKVKYPQIPIYLSGMVMQDAAFLEATVRDMENLYPVMLGFVVVLSGILLRSITGVIAICLIIAAASLSAMGAFGWFGAALSTPSAAAPTIILTVAVGDSLHFLTAFFHLLRQGSTKREALIESVRLNLVPVLLTTLTNAIGFLSMNFSDAPPLRDLGNIVSVGVGYAVIYSMLFLPALLMILPFKPPKNPRKQQPWLDRQLIHWAGFTVRQRHPILIGSLLVTPLVAAGVYLIVLDDNFVEYFDHSYRFRVEADFVRENLTGMDSIEYSLKTGEPGGINDPTYLNRVEQFATWYRKQEGVVHVSAITDIVKRLNANMHNNDSFYARIPEDRNSAAQYLLLYKLSLPRGLDLNNQINLDESATRFTVILRNLSNAKLLDLEQRAYEWLQENTPAIQARGASPSLMFAKISERNINSMLYGNVVSLLLVSAIMLIALRSVSLGLVSLVPNVLPALLAFGIWGYFVGQVGLASSVVFAMTQGIVVDDSVHFMSHYVDAKRRKLTSDQAIRETFLHIGPSMLFTSVILAGGFLILASSGFTVNADMGLLTALTFAIALAGDMLMLTPLILWLESLQLGATSPRAPSEGT